MKTLHTETEDGAGAIQLDGAGVTLVASAGALCGLYTRVCSDGSVWALRATLVPGGVELEDRAGDDVATEVVSHAEWLGQHAVMASEGWLCSCLYGSAS